MSHGCGYDAWTTTLPTSVPTQGTPLPTIAFLWLKCREHCPSTAGHNWLQLETLSHTWDLKSRIPSPFFYIRFSKLSTSEASCDLFVFRICLFFLVFFWFFFFPFFRACVISLFINDNLLSNQLLCNNPSTGPCRGEHIFNLHIFICNTVFSPHNTHTLDFLCREHHLAHLVEIGSLTLALLVLLTVRRKSASPKSPISLNWTSFGNKYLRQSITDYRQQNFADFDISWKDHWAIVPTYLYVCGCRAYQRRTKGSCLAVSYR